MSPPLFPRSNSLCCANACHSVRLFQTNKRESCYTHSTRCAFELPSHPPPPSQEVRRTTTTLLTTVTFPNLKVYASPHCFHVRIPCGVSTLGAVFQATLGCSRRTNTSLVTPIAPPCAFECLSTLQACAIDRTDQLAHIRPANSVTHFPAVAS